MFKLVRYFNIPIIRIHNIIAIGFILEFLLVNLLFSIHSNSSCKFSYRSHPILLTYISIYLINVSKTFHLKSINQSFLFISQTAGHKGCFHLVSYVLIITLFFYSLTPDFEPLARELSFAKGALRPFFHLILLLFPLFFLVYSKV